MQMCRSHILDNTTQEPQSYGGKWNVLLRPPQDAGTCHFNVVDKDGMAVAMTTTVNTPYGSGVYSESTGILLNNEMADFSTPDQPDVFNLPPAEANFIRCSLIVCFMLQVVNCCSLSQPVPSFNMLAISTAWLLPVTSCWLLVMW